jgi:ABC-type dipeptide/oligopeptide/nickel transport system ATPase component
MDQPLLSVRDLTVTFGSFTAVEGVSFDIEAGKTLAVVGESGSGKSVTALSIMRLVELGTRGKIESGEILFRTPSGDVIDLVQQPEDAMREIRGNSISMIFQEPLTSLNPVYPVGDQVAEAVILHQGLDTDAAAARVLEMFRLVRIPEPEKRMAQYPHEMSGGMRQRVMIAMALSCDPQVLIADEPTTALDVTIQAQILGLMRDLREQTGAAVLIITHDMGVVAEVADEVVVMNRSKVVERGPVIDIFENPTEAYTEALLASVPRLGSMAGRSEPAPFDLVEYDG